MNVIIAFVLLYIVALQGYVQPTTAVTEVSAGSAAAAAGMQVGDRVVSIAGVPTGDWISVQEAISSHAGESVPIVVERAGAETTLTATVGTRPDGTGDPGHTSGHRDRPARGRRLGARGGDPHLRPVRGSRSAA